MPTSLEKFRAAAAQRQKEHDKIQREMEARHAAGKEDMKGAIERLSQRLNKEEVELDEVRSEYSKGAHDDDGKALGIRPGSKPEHNPVVKHEVISHKTGHYISVVHKSGMSYSHKQDGKTVNFNSKEDAEKKAAELNNSIKESYEEAEDHLSKANDAEREGRMKDFHMHMMQHHDAMSSWHADNGRHAMADKHDRKSEHHEQKAREIKEEVELEEARGFSKPKGFVEIDKNEYNTHLTNRQEHEKKGITNHREVYTKHNVAGKITHSIEHHAGGQVNHGIPEIAKSVDYEKQQVKYYKQDKKANEDVAVNNVGGGNIAGTQGDAGKKPVMTKEPLKRKKLVEFSEWIELDEYAIDAKGHKSSTGGLTQKGVDYYRRQNPGSKLQTAVTTPPSKLDPDSKAAKRRKSFCARMGGMPGPMKDEKGRPTRKALALRKWNC